MKQYLACSKHSKTLADIIAAIATIYPRQAFGIT